MKKMKKVLALVLCLVLAAGAVTGTLAYLTDRDSEVNVFTVGDVKIDLTEDFEQGATLMPGKDIEKKPTIKNTGKNDAWVWATIAIPAALDNDDASQNVIHFNMSKASVDAGKWTWWEKDCTDMTKWLKEYNVDIDGTKYNVFTVLYQTALKPGETTAEPAIYKVYLDKQVDIDPNGDWYKVNAGKVTPINWNTKEDGAPLIYVSAYAIQTDGFNDVYAAYTGYKGQWDDPSTSDKIEGAEYGEVAVATPSPNAVRPAGYGNDAALLDEVNPVIDGITVVDNSDENTNLRALYAGDGKTYKGNLTVNDSYLDGTYAMNAIGDDTGVLTVTNTDLRGWVSYDGFTAATFTDCTFGQNSNPEYYNNIRPYSAVTFTNCEFDGTTFWLDKVPAGADVTFENCTLNGEKITDANQLEITYPAVAGVVINVK